MTHNNEFLVRCFAAYWGASIELDHYPEGRTTLTHRVALMYKNEYLFGRNPQLLLSPLSEISDEDAIEVMRLLGYTENSMDETSRDMLYEHLENIFSENDGNYADPVSGNTFTQIIDYLRSKSYDCGYTHIPSLIKAGIAKKK